jgi:hypothetical protein
MVKLLIGALIHIVLTSALLGSGYTLGLGVHLLH